MSWQAQAWAAKQTVGHAHSKALLMLLANYADEADSCYPSVEYLHQVLEVSERTVQECTKRLETDGFLTRLRERNENGQLGLTRYYLCRRRKAQPQEAASAGEATEPAEAPSAGKGGLPPEAPSAGDQRQSAHSPAEADAETTGSSFRSDTPVESTTGIQSERDARARAGEAEANTEPHVPDAELLARLIAAHPQSAHDSVADTHAAWKRLSREDRREAVLRFAEWIGAKGARKAIAGLPIYLGEKRWQLLPARAADGSAAKTRLDAFGQPWWWLFHSGVAAQPEAFADPDSSASQALKKQVDLAAMYAIGWTIDPAKHAEIEAKSKVLVKLHKGDPLAEAWRAHYRALGVPMPIPDRADWIFVPAELPQPQEAASAGGASRTGGEDYAAVAEGLAR